MTPGEKVAEKMIKEGGVKICKKSQLQNKIRIQMFYRNKDFKIKKIEGHQDQKKGKMARKREKNVKMIRRIE